MSIIDMAYTQGSRDARMKFAGVPPGAPGSVVPARQAIAPQAGGITQSTGAIPTTSITQLARPSFQGSAITGAGATPAGAATPKAPATSGTSSGIGASAEKSAGSLFHPSNPPVSKATSIAKIPSPIGGNITTQTPATAPAPAVAPVPAQASAAPAASAATPAATPGGIVSSTGVAPPTNPAVDLAQKMKDTTQQGAIARAGATE